MPINNFNFHNPTRILFGKGQIATLDEYLPKDKTFIITYGGGSIKKYGTYDSVIKMLGNRKFEEFGGIEANPDFDTLMKCVERIKKIGSEKCYLLAVGGGSVSDGTKFIAEASCYDGNPIEILESYGSVVKKAVPISVILTLPATGSESNTGCVISYRRIKRKYGILAEVAFPQVAVLDPELSYTLPLYQSQNGLVDAFCHVLEQYITYPCDADCQDRYSEGLLKVLYKNGCLLKEHQNDYTIRGNIMWACNQALNTLIASGVPVDWSTHYIGHELTAQLGLDHGVTLAIIEPKVFQMKFDQKKEKLAMCGENVFGITKGTIEEKAEATIKEIEHFYHDILERPLMISECKCNQDKGWIKEVCDRFRKDEIALGEHKDIKGDDVEKLLNNCY